jgi:hypothetical protein
MFTSKLLWLGLIALGLNSRRMELLQPTHTHTRAPLKLSSTTKKNGRPTKHCGTEWAKAAYLWRTRSPLPTRDFRVHPRRHAVA